MHSSLCAGIDSSVQQHPMMWLLHFVFENNQIFLKRKITLKWRSQRECCVCRGLRQALQLLQIDASVSTLYSTSSFCISPINENGSPAEPATHVSSLTIFILIYISFAILLSYCRLPKIPRTHSGGVLLCVCRGTKTMQANFCNH